MSRTLSKAGALLRIRLFTARHHGTHSELTFRVANRPRFIQNAIGSFLLLGPFPDQVRLGGLGGKVVLFLFFPGFKPLLVVRLAGDGAFAA